MPEEPHQTTHATSGESTESMLPSDGTSMHVKIYAPFKIYYDGEASSVSAANATGPFDILPKHHNFMTLLSPCDIIVRSSHGDERIKISRGIMHVKADKVIVFLDV